MNFVYLNFIFIHTRQTHNLSFEKKNQNLLSLSRVAEKRTRSNGECERSVSSLNKAADELVARPANASQLAFTPNCSLIRFAAAVVARCALIEIVSLKCNIR